MEGQKMEEEYARMTLEEEEAIIAQLTPWERAEYQEMSEFYQIQAATTGQGMVLRSVLIWEKAQQKAPGLLADLLQWIVNGTRRRKERYWKDNRGGTTSNPVKEGEDSLKNQAQHREGVPCIH